jgi:hypothetical protein
MHLLNRFVSSLKDSISAAQPLKGHSNQKASGIAEVMP